MTDEKDTNIAQTTSFLRLAPANFLQLDLEEIQKTTFTKDEAFSMDTNSLQTPFNFDKATSIAFKVRFNLLDPSNLASLPQEIVPSNSSLRRIIDNLSVTDTDTQSLQIPLCPNVWLAQDAPSYCSLTTSRNILCAPSISLSSSHLQTNQEIPKRHVQHPPSYSYSNNMRSQQKQSKDDLSLSASSTSTSNKTIFNRWMVVEFSWCSEEIVCKIDGQDVEVEGGKPTKLNHNSLLSRAGGCMSGFTDVLFSPPTLEQKMDLFKQIHTPSTSPLPITIDVHSIIVTYGHDIQQLNPPICERLSQLSCFHQGPGSLPAVLDLQAKSSFHQLTTNITAMASGEITSNRQGHSFFTKEYEQNYIFRQLISSAKGDDELIAAYKNAFAQKK